MEPKSESASTENLQEIMNNRYAPSMTWTIERVSARIVLYFLSFSGFLVSFMMRTDMNIAMVVMVRSRPQTLTENLNATNHVIPSHCYIPTNNNSVEVTPNVNEEGEFFWSPMIQSSIIGSFYWFYTITQIPGGMLTQRFGAKMVFGWSQLVCAVCSLLIPWGAGVHWAVLIVLRSIQGTVSGFTWPAMFAMAGIWIPIHERSRFLSSCQGYSIGVGGMYLVGGFMIAGFGWRSLFYLTGILGLLWCVFWYFLSFDEPAKHPRISQSELQYIQKHIPTAQKGILPPWRAILTSAPAWMNGITTFGRVWVRYTFMIPGLRYMKTVLGLSIQNSGMLSGASLICSYFSSFIFGWIADKIHTKGFLSLINIRKYNSFLSQGAPGVLVLLIGYLGCDLVSAMVLWFIADSLTAAAFAGAIASNVDIAPNLAGPIVSFTQTIQMTAGFLAPMVASAITSNSEGLEQWRIVFIVAAAVSCVTYIPYHIYGTAEIQDWNYPGGKPPRRPSDSTDALKPLQPSQKEPSEDLQ